MAVNNLTRSAQESPGFSRGEDVKYTDRLRKTDYEVVPVSLSTAQEMVREHHYAKGGSNTAVYTHGLVHRESGNLVGHVPFGFPRLPDAARHSALLPA